MRGIAILLLIVIFFTLIWPAIARWLRRKAAERAEDYMRRQFGMPPREKGKKKKASEQSRYYGNRGRHARTGPSSPIIPKEYAEDVEFIEIKDVSVTEERIYHKGKEKYHHESQVSDVEWTEIRTK